MTPGFWNHMAQRYERGSSKEKEESRLKILEFITSSGLQIKGAECWMSGQGLVPFQFHSQAGCTSYSS